MEEKFALRKKFCCLPSPAPKLRGGGGGVSAPSSAARSSSSPDFHAMTEPPAADRGEAAGAGPGLRKCCFLVAMQGSGLLWTQTRKRENPAASSERVYNSAAAGCLRMIIDITRFVKYAQRNLNGKSCLRSAGQTEGKEELPGRQGLAGCCGSARPRRAIHQPGRRWGLPGRPGPAWVPMVGLSAAPSSSFLGADEGE